MSVEIPDIPYVNNEIELDRMVKPLQLWMRQMSKKKWEFEASPDGVLQYCVLPNENNQRFARYVIFIKKPKRFVVESLFDIPLMKSLEPNITEMKTLLQSDDSYLNYEIQQLPYGSFVTPRDFLFVQTNYKIEGDQYIVISSVNSEKENTYNEKLVRGYKKIGIRVYDEVPNESTNIEVIVCADLRGWIVGYVVTKFLYQQVEPFILLKYQLEKDEREAEAKRIAEEEEEQKRKEEEQKALELKQQEEEKLKQQEEAARLKREEEVKKKEEEAKKKEELEKKKKEDEIKKKSNTSDNLKKQQEAEKRKEEEIKKKKEEEERKKKEEEKKKAEKEKRKKQELKEKEKEKKEKEKEKEKKKKEEEKKKKEKEKQKAKK
ncbi:START domain containing protein, putative [Entamoeba histolytica]